MEIVEEDIIFPCPDSPITRTPRASPTLRGRASRSHSAATRINDYSDEEYDEFFDDFFPSNKSRSIDTVSGGRMDQVSNQVSFKDYFQLTVLQRDHSKLKEAFMQMLNVRFINPQIITVLPFYLQAVFREVQTLPNVKLYLPLPSGVAPSSDSDAGSHFSLESSSSTTLVDTASSKSSPVQRRLSESSKLSRESQNSLQARLHLYRTIEVVRSCKEAIWVEYEKLHYSERKMPNSRLDRDDFEMYFLNWEWYADWPVRTSGS